jgi:hypothetical protein
MDDIFVVFLWCNSLWQGFQVLRQKSKKFQVSQSLDLVYWNVMAATVRRPLKVVAFNANGIGRQAYELRKQLQDLKIDVALFTETTCETTYEVLHSKLYVSEWSPRRE